MSWIKDNKFVVGLAGGTLIGMGLLYVVGSKGQTGYETAKTDYQAALGEVDSYAKMNPYPKAENQDSKKKALDDYRKSLESLQASFDDYRTKETKNVSPQDFTNHLKATNDEVRKALKQSGTKVPDLFFCGFESYKDGIANGKATGILEYQLDGIKSLMLALGQAKATELKNLFRPALVEESGGEYKPQPDDVARALPMEITFMAPEKSVREFLSTVTRMDGKFAVIRMIRISNTKKDPPRAADAKFDTPAAKPVAAAVGGSNDIFGGGFVLPTEEPKPAADPKAEKSAKPAPAPKSVDSGRILSQVLGNEEVQVFIRLDFLRFLPAQKLP
jgi:hypothetical protein